MHISLIASICLTLNIMLLRRVIFTAADVVGCGQNIIVQILASIIVFLQSKNKYLQLDSRLNFEA